MAYGSLTACGDTHKWYMGVMHGRLCLIRSSPQRLRLYRSGMRLLLHPIQAATLACTKGPSASALNAPEASAYNSLPCSIGPCLEHSCQGR